LQRISYRKPPIGGLRGISAIASTDLLAAVVQTVKPGGPPRVDYPMDVVKG